MNITSYYIAPSHYKFGLLHNTKATVHRDNYILLVSVDPVIFSTFVLLIVSTAFYAEWQDTFLSWLFVSLPQLSSV